MPALMNQTLQFRKVKRLINFIIISPDQLIIFSAADKIPNFNPYQLIISDDQLIIFGGQIMPQIYKISLFSSRVTPMVIYLSMSSLYGPHRDHVFSTQVPNRDQYWLQIGTMCVKDGQIRAQINKIRSLKQQLEVEGPWDSEFLMQEAMSKTKKYQTIIFYVPY